MDLALWTTDDRDGVWGSGSSSHHQEPRLPGPPPGVSLREPLPRGGQAGKGTEAELWLCSFCYVTGGGLLTSGAQCPCLQSAANAYSHRWRGLC